MTLTVTELRVRLAGPAPDVADGYAGLSLSRRFSSSL